MEANPSNSIPSPLDIEISQIQKKYKIIGRHRELKLLLIAIRAKKHILLEGEVGTGKTYLARALSHYTNSKFYRVDGSEDILSHVLVGYFDPPTLISKGYQEDAFIYGPLSKAMLEGGCLFLNELNRIPESTQNVLLSALDERELIIPKLKTIQAKPEFLVICTQNPSAHVGVSALGEAIKDRFVWFLVDYQPEDDEIAIVLQNLPANSPHAQLYSTISVRVVRATRQHPEIRRGASIRAAIDMAQLAHSYGEPSTGFWQEAAIMALHSKIELAEGTDRNAREIILEIVRRVLEDFH
jgi:MoxR-like ATPase